MRVSILSTYNIKTLNDVIITNSTINFINSNDNDETRFVIHEPLKIVARSKQKIMNIENSTNVVNNNDTN